jgi:uncharacterized membrane protein HdeD (DUF308 family)
MQINAREAKEFIGNTINKVMVVCGILLLVVALLYITQAFQWVSTISFILGVFLITLGAILHVESFKLKMPSREGWGAILILISAVFLSAAFAGCAGIMTRSPVSPLSLKASTACA